MIKYKLLNFIYIMLQKRPGRKYDPKEDLMRYELLNFIYDKIRKWTWSDYDSNEDFICMNCGKPVFRRYMTCNTVCSRYFDHNTGFKFNE